jgi:hypothetical protein
LAFDCAGADRWLDDGSMHLTKVTGPEVIFVRTAKTVVQVLLIIASLMAAAFWITSAMQPLTLTLDSLQAELQRAASYNQAAAWAAGGAAICQAMNGFVNWLGR